MVSVYGSPLLCVSGGSDSMWMLDFIQRTGIDFSVFHYQHGIRDEEEERQDLDVIKSRVSTDRLHVRHGVGLRGIPNQENAAYIQRWNAVKDVVGDKLTLIITAHHLNDNIESAIMNLMRGKDHSELALKKITYGYPLVKYKPFLEVPKEVIVSNVHYRGIPFHEDITNEHQKNERNWVRHTVIPLLETRRNLVKSMRNSLLKASEI